MAYPSHFSTSSSSSSFSSELRPSHCRDCDFELLIRPTTRRGMSVTSEPTGTTMLSLAGLIKRPLSLVARKGNAKGRVRGETHIHTYALHTLGGEETIDQLLHRRNPLIH